MFNVNLNGTFLFVRTVGKWMIENSVRGKMLMVSSMSGSVVGGPHEQAACSAVCPPLLTHFFCWR